MRIGFIVVGIAGLLFAFACGSSRIAGRTHHAESESNGAFARWPPLILWAWQQPEDLSFIDPRRVGVSYLVETIHLGGGTVAVQPNSNGLKIPCGARLMACARIDTATAGPPALSPLQFEETVSQLASLAKFPDAKAVQVDFDATVSQRGFYRKVLIELRRRLPPHMPLSITALASWCQGDDWIARLPVTEAVPMLFRMGADRASILLRLRAGDDFEEPLCRESAGISADELVPRLPAGRRLYIFNPSTWTQESFMTIMARTPR
jgi:hypothetical protein